MRLALGVEVACDQVGCLGATRSIALSTPANGGITRSEAVIATRQNPERATRERMREQTREVGARILQVSTELFSRKGFLGTTTQEIADSVGLIKGTLYYHIKNKEELLYEIHDQVVVEGIRRWAPIAARSDEDYRVLLKEMILEHCRVIDKYRDAVAVFVEERKFLSPALARAAVKKRDQYQGQLETVLKRGADRGELSVTNVRLTGLMLMSMMNSTYRWYRPGGPWGADELAAAITSLAFDGLLAPTTRPAIPS